MRTVPYLLSISSLSIGFPTLSSLGFPPNACAKSICAWCQTGLLEKRHDGFLYQQSSGWARMVLKPYSCLSILGAGPCYRKLGWHLRDHRHADHLRAKSFKAAERSAQQGLVYSRGSIRAAVFCDHKHGEGCISRTAASHAFKEVMAAPGQAIEPQHKTNSAGRHRCEPAIAQSRKVMITHRMVLRLGRAKLKPRLAMRWTATIMMMAKIWDIVL